MFIKNDINLTIMTYNLDRLHGVPDNLIQISELVAQKNVSFVIRDIEINCHTITSIDVKLSPYKEDQLYKDSTIHMLIPRGLCFIFIDNNYIHTLYGHPKFGNNGEFKSTSNAPSYYAFRRKENGECFHLSAFIFDGIPYIVLGSKNSHLVIRYDHFDEDIIMYSQQRYNYATKMAHLIRDYISYSVLEYLTTSHYTFCGEACFIDSQHIVEYTFNQILFFAVTYQRTDVNSPYVVISPNVVDKLFSDLNLNSVSETWITTQEMISDIEKYFELQENSEGAVVNCMDEIGNVIYVYKHKNYDYIFDRALREQMRNKNSTITLINRMNNLHIVHPRYTDKLDWGLKFNAYYRTLDNQNKEMESQQDFFDHWIDHKKIFNEIDSERQLDILKKFNAIESDDILNVIMLIAIPGSGKSFLARSLCSILPKAVYFEQDMFSDKGHKAQKLYNEAIKNTMNDLDVSYLILSKSNHNNLNRMATYGILKTCRRHVAITNIVITSEGDMNRTMEICIERIMERGFAHRTLFGKTYNEIKTILQNIFVKQWELPETYIELDIEDSKLTIVQSCIAQLYYHGIIRECDTSVSTELIESIFKIINDEDMEMARKNAPKTKQNVTYDSLDFDTKLIPLMTIPEIQMIVNTNEFIIKDEFHITIRFYGSVPEEKCPEFTENEDHEICIIGYAYDDKAIALVIEFTTSIGNEIEFPHITFALKKGIKPVYCKEMVMNALASNQIVRFDEVIKIVGKTHRIFSNK